MHRGREVLMNFGSLATVAIINPSNLVIICVDNGHYMKLGVNNPIQVSARTWLVRPKDLAPGRSISFPRKKTLLMPRFASIKTVKYSLSDSGFMMANPPKSNVPWNAHYNKTAFHKQLLGHP